MRPKLYLLLLLIATSLVMASTQEAALKKFKIVKQIAVTPVKDQSSSSTCWSFGTISFIESELLRMGNGEWDLSEMFIARQVYRDKAIVHVRMMGSNCFTPGGQSHQVMQAIEQHGIVPETYYNGRPYGNADHNHALLDQAAKNLVGQYVKDEQQLLPAHWIAGFDAILDRHLGVLPQTLDYQGKKYTPRLFAQEVLALHPKDYLEITSYTHHPFYTKFCLETKYNWDFGQYHNVPIEDFMAIIDNALNTGYSVCWDGDVTETAFSFDQGMATVPAYEGKVTQALRQQTFDNRSTQVDHIMHITGIAENQSGERYYLTKNSWGPINLYQGYLYLSLSYVKLKTVAIMVHRQAIPAHIAKKMGL